MCCEDGDSHHQDTDFSYVYYDTTPEDEAELIKWLMYNYSFDASDRSKNPDYNLLFYDCRSFKNTIRIQLEKIIATRRYKESGKRLPKLPVVRPDGRGKVK